MAVIATQAKRKYTISGLGPMSLSFEKRQVRSASAQALRDVINDEWVVTDGHNNVNVTIEIRVVSMPGGARMVTAKAHYSPVWVEKGVNNE